MNQKVNGGPFGTGPWACLNKAATHYRDLVIPSVEVTRDFKSTAQLVHSAVRVVLSTQEKVQIHL